MVFKFSEFITESTLVRPNSLNFWKDFIQKFKMLRNKKRKELNGDLYKKVKNIYRFHDDLPETIFIYDEKVVAREGGTWVRGFNYPKNYKDENKSTPVKRDGISDISIGDILIYFRDCGYLFKPNADFTEYTFHSSGISKDNPENKWDDIEYFDSFVKNYKIEIGEYEIPMILKSK